VRHHRVERVFEGGCFFFAVTAEFDARGGPIHDLIAKANRDWIQFLETTVEEAAEAGSVAAGTDAAQLVFEIVALLQYANVRSLLHGDDAAYDRAEAAITHRLRDAQVQAASPLRTPLR
jgi:hypothetical protein